MANFAPWTGIELHTIGHSTRPLQEFVDLLRSAGVNLLIDVRTVPRSRRNPQFSGDSLSASLPDAGIRYEHLASLGGLRRARNDSPNAAWRNASFRGYADHMQTAEFESGLDTLRALAAKHDAALMCAEAVPWRCHRSLVADVLVSRGAEVRHIIGSAPPKSHRLTPFARVDDGMVTYPDEGGNPQAD